MAKSKTQIISEINNKFVTNGNIRAVDTSNTLKDILDCTELNDKGDLTNIQNRLTNSEQINTVQNSRLQNLEENFNNSTQQQFSFEITLQNNTSRAFLSFRGFKNHFVNITFRIKVKESFKGIFIFTDDNLIELKNYLEGIIDYQTNYMLNFLVTVTNDILAAEIGKEFRMSNLNLHFFDEKSLIIRVQNYLNEPSQMMSGDEIYTSIALHSSYIDKTGKITKEIIADAKNPKDVFVTDSKGISKNPTKTATILDKGIVAALKDSTTTKAASIVKNVVPKKPTKPQP